MVEVWISSMRGDEEQYWRRWRQSVVKAEGGLSTTMRCCGDEELRCGGRLGLGLGFLREGRGRG